MRALIKEADPEVVEEWKWAKAKSPGTPVWSHGGIICTGETYKSVVKLTFAKGASLQDPSGLFNSSLEGNVRRAIDIREGEKVRRTRAQEAHPCSRCTEPRAPVVTGVRHRAAVSDTEPQLTPHVRVYPLVFRRTNGRNLLGLRQVETSDTRYAVSGDVHVAYRVFGEGPFDLVFASGLEYPSVEFHDHAIGAGFEELTGRMRVIRFDKRGTGASDRVSGVPSLEERMDDVRAVMDAAGTERAALLGHVDGAAMALLFAATYPERVFALVLFQGKPRFVVPRTSPGRRRASSTSSTSRSRWPSCAASPSWSGRTRGGSTGRCPIRSSVNGRGRRG